jgi:hypothetical protein
MKNLFFAFLGCFFLSAAIAQNTVVKDPNAQTRAVSGFHAIKVSNGIHLYLVQGNEEAVAVSASDKDYRDRIRTEVETGVLKIYYDNDSWKFWDSDERKNLKAYVSCKILDRLKASSGARVDVDGSIKSANLAMDFSSGSNFKGKVNVQELKVEQSSGAESFIGGVAAILRIQASSGSSMKGYELETDQCDANTSSGASVRVTVKKELNASASSGSEIYYKGAGVVRDLSTSSGGEVSKR